MKLGLWFCLLLLCCMPRLGMGQCEGSAAPLRPVTFEVEGTGLRQHWDFAGPDGSLVTVEVDKAYWIGDSELLLWGHRGEDDPRLGLFLLQRMEQFGMVSWQCVWESGLASASLGDYRNLVPVSVASARSYRLLAVDVQDELSTGTVLVLFHSGRFVSERFLPLVRLDVESQNWVSTCPVLDSLGMVRYAADVYRLGWGEAAVAHAGLGLSLPVGASTVTLAPPTYQNSPLRSVTYRLAPHGNVVLGPAPKRPTPKQLSSLATFILSSHGLSKVRIFASEAALSAWFLALDDAERHEAAWKAGLLGEFGE